MGFGPGWGWQKAAPGSRQPAVPLVPRTLGHGDFPTVQRTLSYSHGSRAPIQASPESELGPSLP